MDNTIALSQNFVLIFGAMTVVLGFLILYAITLVVKLTRMTTAGQYQAGMEQSASRNYDDASTLKQIPAEFSDEEDEEERLVAILAASAKVAEDNPNSHYRVTKITRIQ